MKYFSLLFLLFISACSFTGNPHSEQKPLSGEASGIIANTCSTDFFEIAKRTDDLGLLRSETVLEGKEKMPKVRYFHIASFGFGKEEGKIYRAELDGDRQINVMYFAEIDNTISIIRSVSPSLQEIRGMMTTWYFTEQVENVLSEKLMSCIQEQMGYQKTISFEKDGIYYTLNQELTRIYPFDEKNLEKISFLDDALGGNFYREIDGQNQWGTDWYREIRKKKQEDPFFYDSLNQEEKQKYENEHRKVSLFSSKAIYKKLSDNTVRVYSLEIPFYGESEIGTVPIIELFEGEHKPAYYSSNDYNGCGTRSYAFDLQGKYTLSLRSKSKSKNGHYQHENHTIAYKNEDLKIIGKTKQGQDIYGFADANHSFLKTLYQSYLEASQEFDGDKEAIEPMNFNEFIVSVPVFFWDDPFGRRLAFFRLGTVLDLMGGCAAKPVIYLYPTTRQEISVSLDWKHRNLVSIPEYKNTWKVMANPDGNIEFKSKNYPYLFWEDTLIFKGKNDGFVVAKADISHFLDTKLDFLGLNTQEISDFKEFWIDKMQEKPYYFVRFLSNQEMQKIAPITITPRPESIQRVFMDYRGLDTKIQVPEQILMPFTRTGFSVIEWGGNLQQ